MELCWGRMTTISFIILWMESCWSRVAQIFQEEHLWDLCTPSHNAVPKPRGSSACSKPHPLDTVLIDGDTILWYITSMVFKVINYAVCQSLAFWSWLYIFSFCMLDLPDGNCWPWRRPPDSAFSPFPLRSTSERQVSTITLWNWRGIHIRILCAVSMYAS